MRKQKNPIRTQIDISVLFPQTKKGNTATFCNYFFRSFATSMWF